MEFYLFNAIECILIVKILVKKDHQIFGPHSHEEILEFIESGELNEDDLATPDGEENWESLGNVLSSSKQETSDSSIYDQFEDDEVDYEKLKEWEDVFVDEDEKKAEDESFPQETPDSDSTQETSRPVTGPPPIQSNFHADVTPPPPIEPEPLVGETYFPQAENVVEPEPDYVRVQNSSLSLPLPPPPPSKNFAKEMPAGKAVKDRISASHKIKGLNSKQTVIVVKGTGIFSKIYSTSLVFIILFVLAVIVGFAGLIFAPDRVAPIFIKMGVPSELTDTFSSPSVSPKR